MIGKKTMNKICSHCGAYLPTSEFSPSKQTKDKLYPVCRPCKRASDKKSKDKMKAKNPNSLPKKKPGRKKKLDVDEWWQSWKH